MLVDGCGSGCVPSTSYDGRRPNSIRKPPCIRSLGWSGFVGGRSAFRGRPRDTFSESRMRETRLFGSMSGNRKQSHAKPD